MDLHKRLRFSSAVLNIMIIIITVINKVQPASGLPFWQFAFNNCQDHCKTPPTTLHMASIHTEQSSNYSNIANHSSQLQYKMVYRFSTVQKQINKVSSAGQFFNLSTRATGLADSNDAEQYPDDWKIPKGLHTEIFCRFWNCYKNICTSGMSFLAPNQMCQSTGTGWPLSRWHINWLFQ